MADTSSRAGSIAAKLRRLALRLSLTPLHPQWFTFLAKDRARRAVALEANGTLIDIGCGDGELRSCLAKTISYVGVDYPLTGRDLYHARPDVFADAACLPFASSVADAIVFLDVIEHLREPQAALAEAARVLRGNGLLLAHIPYLYPLHDAPHDYSRFTEYGLADRCRRAGLAVDKIDPFGTPAETVALLFNVALARSLWRSAARFPPVLALLPIAAPLFLLANLAGWCLGRVFRDPHFMPLTYFVVARRRIEAESVHN